MYAKDKRDKEKRESDTESKKLNRIKCQVEDFGRECCAIECRKDKNDDEKKC